MTQNLFLPAPSGPFDVGFARFQLVNASKPDRLQKDESRAFEVLVWYPGDVTLGKKAKRYLERHSLSNLETLNALFGRESVAKFLATELTHSFEGIDVSTRKDHFPVLLFSHDIGMIPEYYTILMEYLASSGYFVFSINHPYLSEEAVLNRPNRKKIVSIGFKSKKLHLPAFLLPFMRSSDPATHPPLDEEDYRSQIAGSLTEALEEWTTDTNFLLSYLNNTNKQPQQFDWQPHDFFASRLNLDKVIMLGHGFGGFASLPLLTSHDVAGLVSMNGLHPTPPLSTNDNPVLHLITDRNLLNGSGMSGYSARHLKELDHHSFTDFPFYRQIRNTFQVNNLIAPVLTFGDIARTISVFIQQTRASKTNAPVHHQ